MFLKLTEVKRDDDETRPILLNSDRILFIATREGDAARQFDEGGRLSARTMIGTTSVLLFVVEDMETISRHLAGWVVVQPEAL